MNLGISTGISPSYDVIIVGAGISGLFAALKILTRHPTCRVAIAEKYKALGGRTSTFQKGSWQWEAGAGRIAKNHTMVLELLKQYSIETESISSQILYSPTPGVRIPNPFESIHIPLYLAPLMTLSPKTLATYTLKELLIKIHGPQKTKEILDPFPYRAEVDTLRADMALKTFLYGEMKGHEGYVVVKDGFSALVEAMTADIESRGGVFLRRHTLLNIAKVPGQPSATDCIFQFGRKKHPEEPSGEIRLRAERACFLTLCRCHVAALPFLKRVRALSYVIGRPLFRLYMVFPSARGQSKVWFHDLPRVVTPMRPRYILPISVEKGIIMISYTDADDTKPYAEILNTRGESALESVVLADIRKIFPDKQIPRPIFTKAHLWDTGASYWLPGRYDPAVESERAMRPLPDFHGLFMCGESWSLRQAWVEGALEHTQKCLNESGVL